MRLVLFLIFTFFSQLLLASSYLCPSTNQYVEIGNTLGQVMIACGKPTKIIEPKAIDEPQRVTELVYQRSITKQNKMLANDVSRYQLNIQISNNKIVGILLNGQAVQSTNACYNNSIKVGDSIQKALQYCGKPFLITQTMTKIKNTEPTQLIYAPNSYSPSTTFIFQNGKLVGQK